MDSSSKQNRTWLVPALAAALVALACGGRSPLPLDSTAGAPSPDAGEASDAGDDTLSSGGTGPADAALDGGGGSAGLATIRVAVRVRQWPDLPVPDADLLVSGADGTPAASFRTDSAGNASVDVPPGGALSLLRSKPSPAGTSRSISTVYDASDARPVTFLLGSADDPLPAREPMTLHLSAVDTPAETAAVYFSVPCWSTRLETYPALVVEQFTGCAGKDSFDAYSMAVDGTGNVLAYGELLDTPFIPGQSAEIALVTNRTDFDDQVVSAGPFPDGTDSLVLFMMGYRAGDFARTPRAALRYEREVPSPTGRIDVVQRWPSGHFSDYKFGGRIELTRGGARLISGFDRFSSTLAPTQRFDPGRLALVVRADLSMTDPRRPGLQFELDPSGALGDALRLNTAWSNAGDTTTWSATLLPRRTGALQLPEMPAPFAAFAPNGASTFTEPSATHFDDLARADYWDYLEERVIDDRSNLDSTSLFH